ncbi:MAG: sulfatase [Verrucomicrobia bacterium]|nr:sulfatase [Verrucomicrobiota bacterium]
MHSRLVAFLALLASALLSPTGAAEGGAPRWNILFIFADDWGRYARPYAALDGKPSLNDVITTPHLDRLAREGVTFRHAFVNAPSCTPCRSSLLSGRYFFNTGRGAILRGAVWDDKIPSYPLLLRDAGYHLGKSFKVWSPGTPVDAPIGGQAHAYEKAGRAPNNFSEEATERVAKGMTVAAAREEILAQVRGNFDAFLADRKPGQPWHYFFGPTTTHRKWIKGSGQALWGIDPGRLKNRMPAFLPDVPEVREDVADYLGECQAVDAYVGVLRERLEAAGELERTLIVASGDHGMPGVPSGKCNLYDHGTAVALFARVPGGRGGRVVDDFVCLPDLAPTFMTIGGVAPPAGLYGRSLLGLLRSSASGQVEKDRTWVITGRERHVEDAREGYLPYPMRAFRTKDFVFIRNFRPDRTPMGDAKKATDPELLASGALEDNTRLGYADMDASPTKAWLIAHRNDPQWKWHFEHAFGRRPGEELYDLRKDPDQVKNVAADPAYAQTREDLAARLMKRLTEAGDPRVTGDGMTFERPPFSGPVDDGEGARGQKKKAAAKKAK